LRWGWLASTAASALWDEEGWWAVKDRQVQSVRKAGLLVHLPIYLQSLGVHAALRGEFAMTDRLIAEADTIAEATGTRLVRSAAMILAGLRGKEADASALIEVEARNASAAESGMGVQTCQWVAAVLYNGLGRHEQALAEAQRASEEVPELPVSGWALAELIEAATRIGETRLAGEGLERLVNAASAGATDWGLGVLARSRALLSEGEDADGSYREAIERLSHTRLRPELARAHLLYGEWLRRENRRVDARAQLHIAHDLFTSIGMEAFAQRTRSELHATGESVRPHTVETRDDLTPQERQIAEMARDGLSNPEIGTRLFLSPRTVEWHLRHVFTKLGIKSRRDLARALPDSESEPALT
jgi:ATP/maltotriose-dependent transcriptional regulator MalT